MAGSQPPNLSARLRLRPHTGAILGALVGCADYTIARLAGIEMLVDGTDVTLPVMAFFAATFATLGWVIGRVSHQREQLVVSKATVERQLRELEATRKRAVENETLATVGRLAAGVAHEVRNPLGVIRSSAGMLVEDLPQDDERQEIGEFIVDEVDRLNRFVTTLLDFSRPSPVEPRECEPRVVLQRAADLAGDLAVSISIDIGDDLPDAVRVDPDLLAQAILTLLRNAAEASEESVEIRLRALRGSDDTWVVDVADSGPGIDPEYGERVFEPFVTSRARGTGLGLPMARRIVDSHGGTLELVAGAGCGPDGAGACFRLTIPLTPSTP